MKVSSSYRYSRDIKNLIAWVEYLCVQTKLKHKGKIMERDEMEFNSLFTFGKHEDELLEDVIDNDPDYIEWLVEDDVVPFVPEVMDYLTNKKII